jgi:hypothetical protein
MESFKGVPSSSHQFKQQCRHLTVVYDQKKCQQALEQLIVTGSLDAVQKRFGLPVKECFTKNDLKKFAAEQKAKSSE